MNDLFDVIAEVVDDPKIKREALRRYDGELAAKANELDRAIASESGQEEEAA